MTFRLIHRGQKLTRQQLDVINQILVDHMNGQSYVKTKAQLETVIDKALENAGCPVIQTSDFGLVRDLHSGQLLSKDEMTISTTANLRIADRVDPVGPISHLTWISAAKPVPERLRDGQFILKTECGLAIGSVFPDGSGFDCEHVVLEYAMCPESFMGMT